MPHDANDLADMVILTVKAALAPVLERLSALETLQKSASGVEKRVSELSDRMLTFETKESVPVPDAIGPAVVTAIGPVLERLAATEARLSGLPVAEKSLTELRDRVVVMETKADTPVERQTIDLSPVLERIAALESRIDRLPEAEKSISEVRDRLLIFETKSDVSPLQTGPSEPVDLAPLMARVDELKDAMAIKSAAPIVDLSPLTDRIAQLETKTSGMAPISAAEQIRDAVTNLRERLAVVETRQPVPGPQGPKGEDGKDGKDGRDGKDGVDGFNLEDFSAEFDGDRNLALKFERGSLRKSHTIRLPIMRHEGVYIEGKSYDVGAVVTWGGSQWHCQAPTTAKPGEGSRDWLLVVKRGRDGRDGKDGVPVPIVKVGPTGTGNASV